MKRSDTKERILEAALELFSHFSYDGVGVDQIAARAGIKGPSLYRHFKSKTEMLNHLVKRAEQYYREQLFGNEEDVRIPDSVQELFTYTMKQVRTTLQDSKLVQVRKFFVREQFRSPQFSRLATTHSQTQVEKLYTGIFEGMMRKGILRPCNPGILAMEYTSPIILLVHQCDREPSKQAEIVRRIKQHLQHFRSVYELKDPSAGTGVGEAKEKPKKQEDLR